MSKKFLNLKLERELNDELNAELNNVSNIDGICLECKEGIFNPICSKCLSKEIAEWMKEIEKLKFLNSIKLLRKKVLEEIRGILKIKIFSEKCMKCGGKVVMCPYCFTERIYNVIKDLKIAENEKNLIRTNFLAFFNFDFDKTGYSKEMDVLKSLKNGKSKQDCL